MTEEQITALARELSDSLYNDDKAYNTILWWGEEPQERKAEELEHTLRFLLSRYCLVEKKVINNTYQKTIEQGKHAHFKFQIESRAKLRLLQTFFPEIAKVNEEK